MDIRNKCTIHGIYHIIISHIYIYSIIFYIWVNVIFSHCFLMNLLHKKCIIAGLVKASEALSAFLHPFLDGVPGGFLGLALLLFFLDVEICRKTVGKTVGLLKGKSAGQNPIFDGEKWEKPGFTMDFPFNPVRNAELRISGCQELRHQDGNWTKVMGQLIRVLLEVLRQMTKPKQWIGLRENLHETIVFTMKYRGVPV